MRGVIVARQVPGTGVQPHSDGRNFFLTAHFGLSIPPDCAITVGGEERPWKEDDCIILEPLRSESESRRRGHVLHALHAERLR